jgi:hypothetical protein
MGYGNAAYEPGAWEFESGIKGYNAASAILKDRGSWLEIACAARAPHNG